MFQKTLFIFRRDLRLEDNTGLLFALKNSKEVIPCFIFTPEQIEKNPYRSDHCLQFMIESLEDLSEQLQKKSAHLYLFFAAPENVVEKCIHELGVDAVVVNRDYTPYSIKRDCKIAALCKKHQIAFHSFDDALLHPPEQTLKKDRKPYLIFTPFFRNASRFKISSCVSNRYANYYRRPISFSEKRSLYHQILPHRFDQQEGGRSAALKILKHLKSFSDYKKVRDFPEKEGTTHLSPHLKFTTCSPREIYYAIRQSLGPHSELIRALYWRDFFSSISFYFPHIYEGPFLKKFSKLSWSNNRTLFKKWCAGKTGFPLVDAGMREMNQTGYMHNRVRMVAASLLIKDLHINWQWGEKYFAQTLIDYDPAVNNGNWQWSASTGCDAQPYFRVFNPWSQQEKFDPECAYIKKWIPELSKVPSQIIHNWHREEKRSLQKCSYPHPIVDHSSEAAKALTAYKKAKA